MVSFDVFSLHANITAIDTLNIIGAIPQSRFFDLVNLFLTTI